MITISEMNNNELKYYQEFSYHNFLSETANSSGKSIEEIKSLNESSAKNLEEKIEKINLWLIVKSNNQNVGYVWIQISPSKNEAFGYDIFLEEEFRSKGIGREVMLKCSVMLKTVYHIENIKICVFQSNVIARSLYASLGFQEISFDSDRKQYTLQLTN
jgi:ribosomal protein S18 acetylase RimI-like enzyme